jgi:hypothetical protein
MIELCREELSDPLLMPANDSVRRMVRIGQGETGVHKGAAAKAFPLGRGIERTEEAVDARDRIGPASLQDGAVTGDITLIGLLEDGPDQLVLAREVGVERCLGYPGGSDDSVYADPLDSLGIEELGGGPDNSISCGSSRSRQNGLYGSCDGGGADAALGPGSATRTRVAVGSLANRAHTR